MNDSPNDAASSSMASNPTPRPVAAISLKLPPFWPNDPAVWFAQVEAQFLTRHITSQQTMFAYVISSLQPDIAQEVRDILLNPPAAQPYSHLKAELVKRTSASEQTRLHQLLIAEELGDRKPSQLLRKMRQLLGENRLEDRILCQLFLQRLPVNAQLILASTAEAVPLEQLASLADKILEVATPTVATLASPTPALPTNNQDLSDLRCQVNNLTSQVHSLVAQLQIRDRSPSRHHSGPSFQAQPRARSPARPADSLCWYHRRFGANAHKCLQPCSFASRPAPVQENYHASH